MLIITVDGRGTCSVFVGSASDFRYSRIQARADHSGRPYRPTKLGRREGFKAG